MDWDERYRTYGRCFGDEPNPFTVAAMERLEHRLEHPLTLFFPGDGYGRCGLWAAARGHHVIATDISEVAVEMARAEADRLRLPYETHVCAPDGHALDLPQAPFADACVISWVRVENDEAGSVQRVWNERCTQAVRPGGVITLVTSTRVTDAESERTLWPDHLTWEEPRIVDEEIWLTMRASPSR